MNINPKYKITLGTENFDYDNAVLQLYKISYPELSDSELDSFLAPSLRDIPDPSLFKDIGKSVSLFIDHFYKGNKILILGDYDVDGITATSMWVRFFKYIGHTNYTTFIPNRFKHGYGLSAKSFPDVIKHNPSLIITVDNGINSYTMVEKFKSLSIDVIVTDHHNIVQGETPDCLIINPKQEDCGFPEKEITGVGVAFLFIVELRRKLRELEFWNKERPEPNLAYDLDLVAMGTISDQAPLLGINRIFTYFGLRQIQKNYRADNYQSFYSYLSALYKFYPLQNYNADNELIAFKISPLLNAAGRLENAIIGVNFISANTDNEAKLILRRLDALNKKRMKLQTEMTETAKVIAANQELRKGFCITDPSFHEGLVGLIANKLNVDHKAPAIVFAESGETLKGSCRIPKGGSMLRILERCKDFIVNYGGHDNAAGCEILKKNFDGFKKAYFEAIKPEIENIAATQEENREVEIPNSLICPTFFEKIKSMEPHGVGNPRPIFTVKRMNLGRQSIVNNCLIKWALGNNVEAILWDKEPDKKYYSGMLDLSFEMKHNAHKGKGLQLIIKKIYSS